MRIVWLLPEHEMNDKISHLPGVIQAVNHTAREKAAIAKGYLAAHRSDGTRGHSEITVTRGAVDSWVNLDDTKSDLAAAAIEFGRSGDRPWQGVGALSRAFGISGPHRRRSAGRAAGRRSRR